MHATRECLYRATLATRTLNRSIGGTGNDGPRCHTAWQSGPGNLALLCGASGQVRAASPPQQFDASNFQAAATKASEYCTTLWSDHTFDPFRDKFPLLAGQPTSSMLTNPQRVRPKDKPLADLALKTAEKCKAAAATAWGSPVVLRATPSFRSMSVTVKLAGILVPTLVRLRESRKRGHDSL